jgi:hypothetical protein
MTRLSIIEAEYVMTQLLPEVVTPPEPKQYSPHFLTNSGSVFVIYDAEGDHGELLHPNLIEVISCLMILRSEFVVWIVRFKKSGYVRYGLILKQFSHDVFIRAGVIK